MISGKMIPRLCKNFVEPDCTMVALQFSQQIGQVRRSITESVANEFSFSFVTFTRIY